MSIEQSPAKTNIYKIKIEGILDENWSDWFDGFSINHAGENETILVGAVCDQSALHGLLAKIRDLGLTLVSIESLQAEGKNE